MTELIHTMFGCLQSLLSPLLSQNGPSYSEQGSQFSGLKVISTLHLIAKRCCSSFCATFPCRRKKMRGKLNTNQKVDEPLVETCLQITLSTISNHIREDPPPPSFQEDMMHFFCHYAIFFLDWK